MLENQNGKGIATLVTCSSYPGDPALYPLYRAIVREWVSASARNSDVRVLGSDRLRWAQYPGGKLYLLNTDFDMPIAVKIIRNGWEECVTLNPLELRAVD